MSQLCFSFRFVSLRFIFPPILLCWHGADFHLISSPLFCLFRYESEATWDREIGGITQKRLPWETFPESPLANGCLLM